MDSINGNLYSLFDIQVVKVNFDAEFGGVDQFLQNGAQNANFRSFGSQWGPMVDVHPSCMLYS